jgi:hypothetical protein
VNEAFIMGVISPKAGVLTHICDWEIP